MSFAIFSTLLQQIIQIILIIIELKYKLNRQNIRRNNDNKLHQNGNRVVNLA